MSMETMEVAGNIFTLRRATADDLEAIVELMHNDELRRQELQDQPGNAESYLKAFNAIDSDPAHLLVVVENQNHLVVGTMQLTVIPGLSRGGASRLQIEAVRVHEQLRSNGLGSWMINWAVGEGRRRSVRLVQLTSDQARSSAHRFYERLGFSPSHIGFKLWL